MLHRIEIFVFYFLFHHPLMLQVDQSISHHDMYDYLHLTQKGYTKVNRFFTVKLLFYTNRNLPRYALSHPFKLLDFFNYLKKLVVIRIGFGSALIFAGYGSSIWNEFGSGSRSRCISWRNECVSGSRSRRISWWNDCGYGSRPLFTDFVKNWSQNTF